MPTAATTRPAAEPSRKPTSPCSGALTSDKGSESSMHQWCYLLQHHDRNRYFHDSLSWMIGPLLLRALQLPAILQATAGAVGGDADGCCRDRQRHWHRACTCAPTFQSCITAGLPEECDESHESSEVQHGVFRSSRAKFVTLLSIGCRCWQRWQSRCASHGQRCSMQSLLQLLRSPVWSPLHATPCHASHS